MAVYMIDEASHCLSCKEPLYQEGCPIHTPIPKIIQAFKNGRLNDAAKMIPENSPMSIICSLVCNHENQYEGHCVLGRKGQPTRISSTGNYVSSTCLDKMKMEYGPKNGKKVTVIGTGSAGITIAIMLTKKGYSVIIFDAEDQIGGVLRYGVPEFRLPETVLNQYKKKLLEIGIKVRPNTAIGTVLEIKDLLRGGYESIFIDTGVWEPKTLEVKGEPLRNIHFAIDCLANPDPYDLGERVTIIGMGNSAMDITRTTPRRRATEVTLYVRGLAGNASIHEASYARLDDARVGFARQIIEITNNGPVFRDVYYDEEGDKVGMSEEVEQVYADSAIISVSQDPKGKLVSTTDGLKASESGLLMASQYGETTHPGISAAGDVVLGAKTAVEATAYSKIVVEAMDEYMKQKNN